MIKKEFEHFFVTIPHIEYKKLAITTDSELNNNIGSSTHKSNDVLTILVAKK